MVVVVVVVAVVEVAVVVGGFVVLIVVDNWVTVSGGFKVEMINGPSGIDGPMGSGSG